MSSGNFSIPKLYAERDAKAMGEAYTMHIVAMTAEGLDSKADIAAELAYRDLQILELEQQLADTESRLETAVDVNSLYSNKLTERDKLLDKCLETLNKQANHLGSCNYYKPYPYSEAKRKEWVFCTCGLDSLKAKLQERR